MTVTVIGLPAVLGHLGNLSNGLKAMSGLQATIGTPVPYAEPVHEGARAHDIYPRFKKALFWGGAAHPVTHVRHPGNAPNPFLHDVFTARRDDIVASLALGIGLATQNAALAPDGPFGAEIDDITEAVKLAAPVSSEQFSAGGGQTRPPGGTLRDSFHDAFRNARSRS